jgi:hypothetical protein
MASRIDVHSLAEICSDCDTNMLVYGFQHCKYSVVRDAIDLFKPLKTYDSSAGSEHERTQGINFKIVSGMDDYPRESKNSIKRCCKAALVNIIIENYHRSLHGKPLIAILFCTDIENNLHPESLTNFLDRNLNFITNSELRRAFKLCCDSRIDPKIRAIAQVTFRFVRIHEQIPQDNLLSIIMGTKEFCFERIGAPWEIGDAMEALKQRKLQIKPAPLVPKQIENRWETQLHRMCS